MGSTMPEFRLECLFGVQVSSWCEDNSLELNISKTREIVVDIRKEKQRSYYTPLRIKGTPEERLNH